MLDRQILLPEAGHGTEDKQQPALPGDAIRLKGHPKPQGLLRRHLGILTIERATSPDPRANIQEMREIRNQNCTGKMSSHVKTGELLRTQPSSGGGSTGKGQIGKAGAGGTPTRHKPNTILHWSFQFLPCISSKLLASCGTTNSLNKNRSPI